MLIEVDFNSDEAIYVQLQNQIIMGIATEMIKEGDTLPSVRRLADNIGINMHTVNKAYSILKQEGFIQLDRRRGAVIAIDVDKARALLKLEEQLRILLAKGCCKNITREEVHTLVDEIFVNTGKERQNDLYRTGKRGASPVQDNCEGAASSLYRN